ncbi:MAG: acetyltransferase [Candidatus Omnitrophica bacterium]|nr:acetyltransferase [Candidatus Omnitrophota bacterium]
MNILLFGTGGHAKVVADIVEQQSIYNIVGLVSQDGASGDFIPGYDVVASNSNFEHIIKKVGARGAIVALGNADYRKSLVKKISGYLEFASAIHPLAIIDKSVSMGIGTTVMAGVVVNASTSIGDHCILNTSSSVDHDCKIGDFSHICPGSHIGGHVNIGSECWIGIGSILVDHINIGDKAIVGAGSVVINNIKSGAKVFGAPAK